jgi:hypothetical protein
MLVARNDYFLMANCNDGCRWVSNISQLFFMVQLLRFMGGFGGEPNIEGLNTCAKH